MRSSEQTLSDVMTEGRVVGAQAGEVRRFLKSAALFSVLGLALYAGLYVQSERWIHQYGRTNKFFLVRTTPPARFDYVILGASHAAALGYQDMTARLEALTGKRVVNLALVGGGVRVSRLIYEYFLTRHQTHGLVYVVDSFAFYSKTWNEERLQDTRLFARAPFDPALARLLVADPATRWMGLDYLSGFSKINNKNRLTEDVTPEERSRFTRTYRPVKQVDDQRLAYLYPAQIDAAAFDRYLAEFEQFLRDAQSRGTAVLVVKPPIPERFAARLPAEDQFDARLNAVLSRLHIPLHDFTHQGNADSAFYDTDHLNKDGVINFFEHSLGPLLAAGSAGTH